MRNVTLPNRIIRSATFEGCGDGNGTPGPALGGIYEALARGGVGTIITGFAFVSQTGRAMQPGQCGIDTEEKVPAWREVLRKVRTVNPGLKLFLQIAHAGRQTRREVTGMDPVGASSKRCTYFRAAVRPLDEAGIRSVIGEFAEGARRAREAGFDGVQVHAAHGYLIHQFLSGRTNTRTDRWSEKPLFLEEVVRAIQERCGRDFPLLVKLSGAEDGRDGLRVEDTAGTAKRLASLGVDGLEISYGTMENALNIIRGGVPADVVLEVNPLFNGYPKLLRRAWKRFFLPRWKKGLRPFGENYNVGHATLVKREAGLPVVPVGGIRSLEGMLDAVGSKGLDGVALCRPLLAEPDLPARIRDGRWTRSKCVNCNLCTVHCDSEQTTRCHTIREVTHESAGR
jgi:2,4-dienoyl-CoA reductase-like NADH-dependent reductase (Old Yellow Enzyme family)